MDKVDSAPGDQNFKKKKTLSTMDYRKKRDKTPQRSEGL